MRFSKLFFSLLAISLIAFMVPNQSSAKGKLGMSAAIGLPSGITPAVSLPTNTLGSLTISTAATSSFNILLSDNLQLDLGLGYLSVTPNEGDGVNTVSIGAGVKYFMGKGDVSPYITGGFSFTNLPTITSVGTERTGNMITFLAAYGAQAYLNSSNTVALFVQMGLGYNTGSITTDITGGSSTTTSISNLNLGGSAVGVTVYF